MSTKKQKVEIMNKIESQEKLILELEKWEEGKEISGLIKKELGGIYTLEQRDKIVSLIKNSIEQIKKMNPDNDKLFLSDLIEKDKIEFKSNSLILAPVGSGKTTLIKKLKKPVSNDGKILMLVSNTTLKEAIAPTEDNIKKLNQDGTYTTKDKVVYGDKTKKTHVMSYAEFGNKIRYNDKFVDDVNQIFCDEIHSLPDYQSYSDSSGLSIAIKYLFQKQEGKQIYYFTATRENIDILAKKNPDMLENIDVYNYLDHPEIRKYIALSEYKINGIDQIRPHLKARLNSFNYFGYKALAFNKTIEGQKRIAKIAEEEGYKPLVLWSINNSDEPMTEKQLSARKELIETGNIPKPYNFLIINNAMQEGWDLLDEKVKLAIINTTNETEKIQSVGRLRRDLDILVYRVSAISKKDIYLNLDEKYINVDLTTEDKAKIISELNMKDRSGRDMKWPSIKKILEKQGYVIVDSQKIENGKKIRFSKIIIPA